MKLIEKRPHRRSRPGRHKYERPRSRRVLLESLEPRNLLPTITVTSLDDNLIEDGKVTLREALPCHSNSFRSANRSRWHPEDVGT
ncbi:hypothetical protein Rcae01_04558 [Novipirellula caenicola]|uniref:Uncharacterized protein n=1 Tax=Novipirellula caenicola TaxID=1536901 RepID=A0ABP9VVB5_9BACT